MEKIRRTDALRLMEVKEKMSGKPLYFSVQFYKKDGSIVTLPRARLCGLRSDMKTTRTRGIQEVDFMGNAIGHIYTVSIDNLRMVNDKQVVI